MYSTVKRGKRQVMSRPSWKKLNGRLNKCGVISPRLDLGDQVLDCKAPLTSGDLIGGGAVDIQRITHIDAGASAVHHIDLPIVPPTSFLMSPASMTRSMAPTNCSIKCCTATGCHH